MKSRLNVTLHPSSEHIYARRRSEILRNIELFSLWAKVIKQCSLKIQTSDGETRGLSLGVSITGTEVVTF